MTGRLGTAALTLCLTASLALAGAVPTQAAGAVKAPPKPTLTKVAPKQGPTTGGTTVVIKGKGLTTASKVLFDGVKGTGLEVKNDHKLTVVAPAHASGAVDVQVKTKGGKSASTTSTRFTYVGPVVPQPQPQPQPQPRVPEPLRVTGVTPDVGWLDGGTRVTLTGTGLTDATSVAFGGEPGTSVTVVSPTQLTVIAPAHAVETVDIVVTTPAGSSPATEAARFTYVDQPVGTVAPAPAGAASNPNVRLQDLACPAAGQCTAVGSFDGPGFQGRPLAERLVGGTWTASELPVPADAAVSAPTAGAWMEAVSCPTTSFCVAVGSYYTTADFLAMMIETWNGVTWSAQAVTLPPDATYLVGIEPAAVSCGSVTSCVAVGTYVATGDVAQALVVTLTDGTWTAQAAPKPAGATQAELFDVDCAAHQSCVAVGDYTVTLPDQRAFAVSLSGTTWTATALAPPPDARTDSPTSIAESVDCVGATSCTTVGVYYDQSDLPHALAEVGGPGAWEPVDVPDPVADAFSSLNDVSCSGPGECTAIGDYSDADPHGRTWAALIEGTSATSVPVSGPGDSSVYLEEISCAATGGDCAAVGSSGGALVAKLVGLTVTTQHAVVPTGAFSPQLSGVAGDSPTSAVGIGYVYSDGGSQGLLVVGIPR